METLYQTTIFANLALLAIVIAIFVFTSSIHGGASKIAVEEEENLLARRGERVEEAKKELVDVQIKGLASAHFVAESKVKIMELDNDLTNIDRLILEARNRGKALTLRNMVTIPSSFLLVSIITSGIAIATSETFSRVIWILSLALIVTSLCFIYRNLRAVERFSSVMDLSTVLQQALEPREMKLQPAVDMSKSMREDIATVLSSLPPKESRIIEMYYGIGRDRMSLAEIAKELGDKEETIKVRLARALRMSRHPSRSRRLKGYLDSIPVIEEKTGDQLFLEDVFGGVAW